MASSPPDPLDVSTDDLRYLLAVARSGRLVSAATLLGVDHTTVRRRIDRLEATLGGRLLDRAASGGSDGLRGTVRIVAPEAFGTLFVVPALARVQADNPGITVELVTSTK